MKKSFLTVMVFAVLALLFSGTAAAADSNRIRNLEKTLAERDKVILELLERVKALERRSGIHHRSDKTQMAETVAQTEHTFDAKKPEHDEPGRIVVDKDAEERALERALVMDGGLLLPAGSLEIEPRMTYSLKEDAAPNLLVSNGSLVSSQTENNSHSFVWDLAVRYGLPQDFQLELGLPWQWRNVETENNVGFSPISESDRSGGGVGDLRIGLAKTLMRESVGRPDLIGRISWDTDTGNDSDNGVSLGGGYHELGGSLTAVKRQDPLAFVMGLAGEYSFEKDRIQPGISFSANVGGYMALSPETSIHSIFSIIRQEETSFNGKEISGSDRLAGSFSIGGSTLLSPGLLMNLSLGIGLTEDANDFSLSASFPFRVR